MTPSSDTKKLATLVSFLNPHLSLPAIRWLFLCRFPSRPNPLFIGELFFRGGCTSKPAAE